MKKVPVAVKKVDEEAKVPKYHNEGDAGFDFVAKRDYRIRSNRCRLVGTGLKMSLPEGYEIQVRPRGGISLETPFRIGNAPGTIDSGYKGEIKIIVWNTADYTLFVRKGDRIAQGVLKRAPQAEFKEADELPESMRGEDGFGSTGKNDEKEKSKLIDREA